MNECGFFDSVNGDRKYTAGDMTRPYELLVSNGVFATPQGTPSTYLQVYANGDMTVTVKPGRGIFKDKWKINPNDLLLTLEPAEVTLSRVDSIIVRSDTSTSVRNVTIEVKKGEPSSNAVAPVMERSEDVYEYRLADVTIAPQTTEIEQSDIRDQRGSADCPWVTSLIQQVDTSTLWVQWQDAFDKYYSDNESRFDAYHAEFDKLFTEMKATVGTLTMSVSEGSYETTSHGETSIPVDVEFDTLVVYINGLHAVSGRDYTLSANTIKLLKTVNVGTVISYVAYKQATA